MPDRRETPDRDPTSPQVWQGGVGLNVA